MISIGTSVFEEPETLQALQLGQHGMQVVSKRSQSLRPIREEGEILESNVNESVHHPMEPGEVSGSSTFQHGQNIGEVDDMCKFLVEPENNTGDESEKLKREMEGLRIKLEKSKKKHKSCKVQLKELQKQLQEAQEEAAWYINSLEVEKQGNKETILQASQQMLEETVDISKENLVEPKLKGVEEHVACLTLSRAIEKEEYKKSLEQVRKDLAEEISKRKQVEELISDYATVLRQINGRQALIGSSSAKQIEELELENLKLQRMLTEKTQGIHIKEELQNIQPQGGMHHTSRSSEEIDPDNSQVTNSDLDSEYIN
jgi:chromosome segregation ATPase